MSKVWFVTGAGSGIGTGIAKAALKSGDRVVATGRDLNKVRGAFGEVTSANLAFLPLDVTDEDQAAVAVEEVVKRFGQIDVLVNNAGYSLLGNFEQLARTDIEQQFATNFFGLMWVTRAVLPVMRKQRSGHVFNISSVAGVVGFPHCSIYGATKFAVEGLSLALVNEVGSFGIKVTVVEPGFFRTDLLDPRNVRWGENTIEDYAPEGSVEARWSPYHGTQQGDPLKLGEALVKLALMEEPPKVFVAGGDALQAVIPAIKERLRESQAFQELSKSSDGVD